MKTVSIIIPAYNEAASLPILFASLGKVLATLTGYQAELLFVDDGSTDETARLIGSFAATDIRVRTIELSRNFGKEAAVSAGLRASTGDAAIIIDADLQHPPELIPSFISKWESGADTVIGVRERDGKQGIMKRVGSDLFYWIINRIGATKITPYATDYRLVDRRMVDEFNGLTERNRITRGLFDWMGFKREYIVFKSPERRGGTPAYDTIKLVRLALSSFVAHSLFPLKFAGYLGVCITLVSGVLGAFVFIEQYTLGDPWHLHFSGTAILAIINVFLVGMVLCCLGLTALYIASIHAEVVNRPLYVIRRKNF